MSEGMIKVGMADVNVCHAPGAITTLGLGSCVGVVLYDRTTRTAGLAHVMLPDSTKVRQNQNKAKFADTGIDLLIEMLRNEGANCSMLTAKIAGGAQMFAFSTNNDMLRVGERNVEAVKAKLKELGIRILAEDTGANYGRTVEFYPETGDFLIKSVGKPEKIIEIRGIPRRRKILKTEYIPKVITLLAGAVVCIVSIVRHMDTTYSLEILLAALIIFYIIGCLARHIIERVMVSNRFVKEVTDEMVKEAQEAAQEESSESEEAEETSDH